MILDFVAGLDRAIGMRIKHRLKSAGRSEKSRGQIRPGAERFILLEHHCAKLMQIAPHCSP